MLNDYITRSKDASFLEEPAGLLRLLLARAFEVHPRTQRPCTAVTVSIRDSRSVLAYESGAGVVAMDFLNELARGDEAQQLEGPQLEALAAAGLRGQVEARMRGEGECLSGLREEHVRRALAAG